MILKVRYAATPTCRGCVSSSVCVTQAINGRCCYTFSRPPLGLGGGGLEMSCSQTLDVGGEGGGLDLWCGVQWDSLGT